MKARPGFGSTVALVAVLGLAGAESVAAQGGGPEALAIVVNRANPVDDLSTDDLRKAFLGGQQRWPNGRKITVVMRPPGDIDRDVILRSVCRMTEAEFQKHVLQATFTGETSAGPRVLDTALGVKRFVFNVPGAIGYLRLSEVDDTVKVIHIDGRAPTDPGYRLTVAARSAGSAGAVTDIRD
jgi:ABC-type phosphate transport system substrate-binding protein